MNLKKPVTAINACDFTALENSVKKVLAMPIKQIYPGHGEPFAAERMMGR